MTKICNNDKKNKPVDDYRFVDYRLTQLEHKIETGLTRIEKEQREYNLQVMATLSSLQDGQTQVYETLARIKERQDNLEQKVNLIDAVKEKTVSNKEQIQAVQHRINIIQKILFIVATAAISGFITALFSILLKIQLL